MLSQRLIEKKSIRPTRLETKTWQNMKGQQCPLDQNMANIVITVNSQGVRVTRECLTQIMTVTLLNHAFKSQHHHITITSQHHHMYTTPKVCLLNPYPHHRRSVALTAVTVTLPGRSSESGNVLKVGTVNYILSLTDLLTNSW